MLKHDQQYIKQQNKQWVYELIKEQEPITKPNLVKQTKMSPTSIGRIVSDLVEQSLIIEAPSESTGVGRNAVRLEINRNTLWSIGVELDMDTIRIGLINLKGELCKTKETAFQVRGEAVNALNKVAAFIEELLVEENLNKQNILGIGIGVPGLIHKDEGIVVHSDQLLWENVDVGAYVEAQTGLDVFVDNELKMQVMAEQHKRDVEKDPTMVLVGIGSGVGSAVVINGDIYRGQSNRAGEIGHTIVNPHGNMCKCGRMGCLATYVSEKSLLQQAQNGLNTETMEELSTYYKQGNPLARSIIDQATMYIAIAIGNVCSTFDPKTIVLSGQFFSYLPEARQTVEENSSDDSSPDSVQFSSLNSWF
ncbi:ROK family protein [Bacillus sp. JCM 19041]|uniref:ROK family protein n=1 Tax=Bacillus sp. JCM 19041 TaxID=1460637 RepID=UPI0006CF5F82